MLIYSICTQYLVGAPFALITASIRRATDGLMTICAFGNKSSAEMRADPLLAEELNTFYGCFECNGGSATLPISASGSSRQSSDDHVITIAAV